MTEERQPSEFAIVALGETRGADGALTRVRFTYRGRDLDAARDPERHEWRVRANGRDLGRVHVLACAGAPTVAEVIIGTFFPD